MDAGSTAGIGQLRAASSPRRRCTYANCAPTEISICRQMMTSAMPQATIRPGASRAIRERNGCNSKKRGCSNRQTGEQHNSATATDHSRKYRWLKPPPPSGPKPQPSPRSASAVLRSKVSTIVPRAHHRNPIAHAEHFGEVARNQHHCESFLRQLPDNFVDFRFGSHIYSLCWFVQDQNRRFCS